MSDEKVEVSRPQGTRAPEIVVVGSGESGGSERVVASVSAAAASASITTTRTRPSAVKTPTTDDVLVTEGAVAPTVSVFSTGSFLQRSPANEPERGSDEEPRESDASCRDGDDSAPTTATRIEQTTALATTDHHQCPPEPPVIVSRDMVEFSLEPIKQQLTCKLCQGLFREPYTLTKCLHTFCKSCFFLAFSNSQYECPTCDQYLGQNRHKSALPDRVLQNLIDKVLFPEMAEQDRLDEEAFYANLGIERKPVDAELLSPSSKLFMASAVAATGSSKKRMLLSEFADTSSSGSKKKAKTRPSGSGAAKTSGSSSFSDEILFRLVPHDNSIRDGLELPPGATSRNSLIQPLKNPYIKTSGSLHIGQLKKYLSLQLTQQRVSSSSAAKTSDLTDHRLEVCCQNVSLGNELTIHFVKRAIWFSPASASAPSWWTSTRTEGKKSDEILTLTYRLGKIPKQLP